MARWRTIVQQRMTFRSYVVSQFRQPHGPLGHVAGWVMAHRQSNIQRNRWTVRLLDLQPNDRVLELGCGPGVALEAAIAALIPSRDDLDRSPRRPQTQGARLRALGIGGGGVVGVDHSSVMLRQAARRNAAALRDGTLQLHLSGLEGLAGVGEPFTKIFSVNVAQFFPDKVAAFRALAEALAPGGLIATTHQPRQAGAIEEDAQRAAEAFAQAMRDAGLSNLRIEHLPLRPVSATCVLGSKPRNP